MSRPKVKHYEIPGTELELVDIIEAKSKVAKDPWEFFLWGSCLQYLWRYDLKSDPVSDLDKALVYLTWLRRVYAGRQE